MFAVKKLEVDSMKEALLRFQKACAAQGIVNNGSMKSMKLADFEDIAWWGAFAGSEIVSVSACYPCATFGPGYWRVLFRSATLQPYRALGGSFSKDLAHDFCFGQMLPLQMEYALSRGGKNFFFSTNSVGAGGVESSRKVDRFVRKVLLPLGRVRLLKEDFEYFNCRQNIWEICH